VLLFVDERDSRPIYLQIAAQVKEQIRKGQLHAGEELPSVRDLASTLDINLHTAHRAYQVLRDEGIVVLRLGRRPRVAELREEPADRKVVQEKLAKRLNELITEAFHLGLSPRDFRSLVDEMLQAGRGKR
jgi:DNA-binding transcriptional regulator YhcF (GntR family)